MLRALAGVLLGTMMAAGGARAEDARAAPPAGEAAQTDAPAPAQNGASAAAHAARAAATLEGPSAPPQQSEFGRQVVVSGQRVSDGMDLTGAAGGSFHRLDVGAGTGQAPPTSVEAIAAVRDAVSAETAR